MANTLKDTVEFSIEEQKRRSQYMSQPLETLEEKQNREDPGFTVKEKLTAKLEKKFKVDGKEFRFKEPPNDLAFKDGRKKITTTSLDERAITGMISMAQAKGWDSISVTGNKEFKKQAWLEAKKQGIEVSGYKPTKEDLDKLSSFDRDKEENTRKGERQQPIRQTVFEGELLKHGTDYYQGNGKNNKSYFATIRTAGGDKTVWGKDLARVINNSGNKVGDEVRLEYTGKKNQDQGGNGSKKGRSGKVNGWRINDSKEIEASKGAARAVVNSIVEGKIRDPAEREAARSDLYKEIGLRPLRELNVYDKDAPKKAVEKSRAATDLDTERTR